MLIQAVYFALLLRTVPKQCRAIRSRVYKYPNKASKICVERIRVWTTRDITASEEAHFTL